MEIIYVYSTETLKHPKTIHKPHGDVHYKAWFKIGMTTQETADDRIIQQDRTSNPEPLQKLYDLDIVLAGHTMTAYELEQKIHRTLDRSGKRVRNHREWFEFDGNCNQALDEIKKLIETILDDSDLNKKEIKLKKHQIEADNKIDECFASNDKKCLLHHKPRSGKTFITLYNIKKNQYKNVVILTSYPILNYQWEEIIEDFKGFSNYTIINVSGSNIKKIELGPENNIVLLSLQDVKGGEEVFEKEKFELIKDINWDLIVIDEVHYGVETERTQEFLDKIQHVRLLGLSATPGKNLICGRFSPEQIHTYTLAEENKFKDEDKENYPYADINYYLWNLTAEEKKLLKSYSEEEQLTMKKLFRIEDGEFFYKSDIIYVFKKLIGDRSICKNDPLSTLYPFKNKDRFNSVKSILCFVPSIEVQEKLKKLLEDISLYSEEFNVFFTNSQEYSSKALISAIKREFKSGDKRSLIIAVEQLTTGITLEDCDMVVFMNDWASVDKYVQASFRCQSPRVGKKNCFVLDLNPARSFELIWEYNHIISKYNGKSTEETLREWFNCVNVFNRVDGGFEDIDFDKFNSEYMKILVEKPRFNYTSAIYSDKLELVRDKLIGVGITAGKGSDKKKLDDDGIDKGKSQVGKVSGEKKVKEPEISKEKLMEIAKALLDKSMLVSIFTYHKHDSIDKCFEALENDLTPVSGIGELESKMFMDTLLIGISESDKIKLSDIKFIYNNIYNKDIVNEKLYLFNQKVKKIIEIWKENPERTDMLENYLDLINSYLKISTTEKKVFAEVMTDFKIVDEMLDLFDQNDFKDHTKTFFGPTAGMGNFQVKIVERLMNGLKDWQPDPEKRLKHILENQIYVCEIQAKNLFLFINIFDPERKYNLNYFRGDFRSKAFDNHRKNVWKKDNFDRIVENPPFNQMIDMDILSKSYDLADQIIFVHPSTWLLDEKNKQSKFIKTKDKVGEGLRQVILFNGNNIFGIALFVPCAITYFDKNKKEKGINCFDKLNNKNIIYDNIYQINKFSDVDIYLTLKKKLQKISENDNIWKYYQDSERNKNKNFMVSFTGIRGNVYTKDDSYLVKDDFYTIVSKERKPQKSTDKVGSSFLKFYFDTEKECENFLSFLKTNFSRFAISCYKNNQNLHRGELEILPWLDFTKEWNDEKLNIEFNFSQEEIQFINSNTVKYY